MRVETRDLGRSVPGQGGARWLYRHLNLRFESGSLTAVLGPNGAGKSTLLRDIAGLRAPQEGSALLGGRALAEVPPEERARQIAYLPQRTTIEHDMPIHEVAMLGRAPHIGRFAAPGVRDREHALAALGRVGLGHLGPMRPVRSLSGGEFQRVMLARMLATEAPVLVLDEPTAALDIGHALGFLALCRELAGGGATVIVAMHDLERARQHADQAVLLTGEDGGDVHVGAAGDVVIPDRLAPVFGVVVSTDPQDGALRFRLPQDGAN